MSSGYRDEAMSQPPKTKVFISYSRRDMAWVDQLVHALQANDIDVLIDREDIVKGEPWKPRIFSLIENADTIVFVISPDSVGSKICFEEVAYAESLNKRFVPIVIHEPISATGERLPVPPALSRINYIIFTHGSDADAALDDLLQALLIDLDWVREHTRLGELALHWEKSRKPSSQLLRGRELDEAEKWRDDHHKISRPPTELHHQFIRDSRTASTRRVRNWRIGSAISACVVAAGIFALNVVSNQRELEKIGKTNLEVNNTNTFTSSLILAEQFTDASLLSIESLVNNPAISKTKNKDVYSAALNLLRASRAGNHEAHVIAGHTKPLVNAIFSPDAKFIATSARDNTIRIVEADTKQLLAIINSNEPNFLIRFNEDSTALYTSDIKGWVYRWDIATKTIVAKVATKPGTPVALSHNCSQLAYITNTSTIRILDGTTFNPIRDLIGHSKLVTGLDFSPDDAFLASTSLDMTARIWDTESAEQLRLLKGHTDVVGPLHFGPDSDVLATGSKDGTVRLWRVEPEDDEADLIHTLRPYDNKAGQKPEQITVVRFSPLGDGVAAVVGNNQLFLWDAADGGEPAILNQNFNGIRHLVFSPDGSQIAVATFDPIQVDIRKEQAVTLWNAEPPLIIAKDDPLFSPDDPTEASITMRDQLRSPQSRLSGHLGSVYSVAFSPDNKTLLTSSSDGTARLWNPRRSINTKVFDHKYETPKLAFFVDSDKSLVTVTSRRIVRVWNIKNQSVQHKYKIDRDCLNSFFAAKSAGWFICLNGADIEKRQILTGELITKLVTLDKNERLGGLSDNGAYFTTILENGTGPIRTWSVDTRKILRTFRGHTGRIVSGTFSSDGRQFLTAGNDRTIRIWDTQSDKTDSKQVISWPLGFILIAKFIDNDKKIVAMGSNTTYGLWDIANQSWVEPPRADPDNTRGVLETSSDGKYVAVGYFFQSADKIRNGLNVFSRSLDLNVNFHGNADFIQTVGISSDGKLLVSGGDDSKVRIWPLSIDPNELIAKSMDEVPRCITTQYRKWLRLNPSPPRWCVTGPGNEDAPRERWAGKWPYNTEVWKNWLAAKDAGISTTMPVDPVFVPLEDPAKPKQATSAN